MKILSRVLDVVNLVSSGVRRLRHRPADGPLRH